MLKTQKLFQHDRSHAFHYIIYISGAQRSSNLSSAAKGNFYFIWTRERTSAFYLAGAPPPPKSFAVQREILYFQNRGCNAFCSWRGRRAEEVINSFLRWRGDDASLAQRPNCVLRLFVYQTDRTQRRVHIPAIGEMGVCFSCMPRFSLSLVVRNAPI